MITSLGVKIHYNCMVGKNKKMGTLRKNFDAIVLAVGAQAGRRLELEGENCSGVIDDVS